MSSNSFHKLIFMLPGFVVIFLIFINNSPAWEFKDNPIWDPLLISPSTSFGSNVIDNTTDNNFDCNCVIFRIDDIQDYWLNSVQSAVMDLFLNKNQTLSLGLIMNAVGNDTKIIEKIKEGVNKGLFELDIHGWDHTDYTNLTEQEQKESLIKSNTKMQQIFGKKTVVFIPPLSVFDYHTLNSMMSLGMSIISSDLPEEKKFMDGKSIYIAKAQAKQTQDNHRLEKGEIDYKIDHLPATVFFKEYEKGIWVKIPNEEIIANTTNNIAKYGYSVIALHPQDFALLENKTMPEQNVFINSVDDKQISDLSKLLDIFLSNNMKIRGFVGVTNST